MIGVLLVNMGGANNPQELKTFLKNMFLDKHIIQAPHAVRYFLSNLISKTRYKKSWKRYELIGGSPLKNDSENLKKQLQYSLGENFKVEIAYSYSNPFICDSLDKLKNANVDQIVAIPLYPQYSITTTQSVIDDIQKWNNTNDIKVRVIREFYQNEKFIDFWSNIILNHIKEHHLFNPVLVFSAHSIPLKFIKQGDTYQTGIETSAKLISSKLNLEYIVSYQSSMNKRTWLVPDTIDTLRNLTKNLLTQIVIIPISFINENLETLYDIDNVIIPRYSNNKNITITRTKIPDSKPELIELFKQFANEND